MSASTLMQRAQSNTLGTALNGAKYLCEERSSKNFFLRNSHCKNTKLIRLVYLFKSKRVFAFVTFIPILPVHEAPGRRVTKEHKILISVF